MKSVIYLQTIAAFASSLPLDCGALAQTAGTSDAATIIQDTRIEELRAEALAAARREAIQSPTGMARILVGIHVSGVETLQLESATANSSQSAAAADEILARTIRTEVDATIAALGTSQFVVHRVLRTVPAFAISVSVEALELLDSMPEVWMIQRSVQFRPALDVSTQRTGAVASWALGFDGTGTFVAILDSGILRTHEMFAGKTIIEACFSSGDEANPSVGDCPNGQETQIGEGSAAPHPGRFSGFDHGTHVAGIAAGADFTPPNSPMLHGVARGADIIAVQVFTREDDAADCEPPDVNCMFANPDDFAAALELVYSLRQVHNIAAANMSLGGGSFNDQTLCDLTGFFVKPVIDNLRLAGIATVISSGNGSDCDGVSFPGCISSAIAVGNVDDDDEEFQSSNFHAMLDLYAPGVSIDSAGATSNTTHLNKTGTSMAAPHVAGAIALIRDAVGTRGIPFVFEYLKLTAQPVAGRCVASPSQRRIQIDQAIKAAQVDVWVDFDYSGASTGSIFQPWNTFIHATLVIPEGGSLGFKGSGGAGTGVVTRAMTMRSFDGATVIGQ